MKKLLNLLSIVTISGITLPTTIATSSYQKEEQIKLNRVKRDWLDHFLNIKLTQQQIDELNNDIELNVLDNIYKRNGFSEPVVNTITTSDGTTFKFEWKWYKVFYWNLSMNDKACKKVLNSSAGDFISAISGIIGNSSALFSIKTATAAGAGVVGASVYLNSLAFKEIIKNNNKVSGVWIGFWINQPGVGWGSL